MSIRYLLELESLFDEGWLPHFRKAAIDSGWPLHTLLGLASRESNMRHIIGDNGNGYGLLQIDIRTDPSVPEYWQNKEAYIKKAVSILTEKRTWILVNEGKLRRLGPDSKGNVAYFVVPRIEEPTLSRVTIACYNAGAWPVYQYSRGADPDRSTTGGNYSQDVLARASFFETFIRVAMKFYKEEV